MPEGPKKKGVGRHSNVIGARRFRVRVPIQKNVVQRVLSGEIIYKKRENRFGNEYHMPDLTHNLRDNLGYGHNHPRRYVHRRKRLGVGGGVGTGVVMSA